MGVKGTGCFYVSYMLFLCQNQQKQKVLLCDVLVMIQLFSCWRSEHCEDGGVKIEVVGKE